MPCDVNDDGKVDMALPQNHGINRRCLYLLNEKKRVSLEKMREKACYSLEKVYLCSGYSLEKMRRYHFYSLEKVYICGNISLENAEKEN